MRRSRRSRRGVGVGLALALVASLALGGCAAGLSEHGEALTVAQAEQLAGSRFALYAGGEFVVELAFRDAGDVEHISATLTVDPERHRAWGELAKGPEGLALTEAVALTPGAIAVQRDGLWRAADLPSSAQLALQSVFMLASDRPENAQLLRQTDAVHLGSQTVEGERLEVFRLPAATGESAGRTRLWVAEGGEIRRFDGGDDGGLVLLVGGEAAGQPDGVAELWAVIDD